MPLKFPPFVQSHLGHPFRLAAYVLNVYFITHVAMTYGFTVADPVGASMLPHYAVYGERYIISKSHKYGRGVKVGDAVAFKIPVDPAAEAIKRVVGMPGDY